MSTNASNPPASRRLNGIPLDPTKEWAVSLRKYARNIGKAGRLKASFQVGDPGRLDEATIHKAAPLVVLHDDVAMTLREVCAYFGGSKPINPATLYKGIAAKRYPKPFKSGPQTSRWLKSEVVAARRKMIQGRDAAPPLPTGKRK